MLLLQKEKEQQSEQHEQTLLKLQAKHEADISHLHQEHALSAAKVQINHTYAQPFPKRLIQDIYFFSYI